MMPYEPYEPTWYQIEDSDTMLETESAHLWADAGTGKTVTALEAFRKGGYDRGVIICPPIAMTMWKEEIEKHLGKRSYILYTGRALYKKQTTGLILHAGTSFIITSFGLAEKHRDIIHAFRCGYPTNMRKSWGKGKGKDLRTSLIIDEAHYLKTKLSKRTRAIFGHGANNISGIVEGFTDVWQLTGTPLMRHADDLWTQLRVTRYEILKHYDVHLSEKFIDKFCKTKMVQYSPYSPWKKVTTGSKNLDLLAEILEQCGVIKRKLQDVVADLPPITHRTVEAVYTKVPEIDIDVTHLIRELNKKDSVLAKAWKALGMAKAASVVEYAKEFGDTPLLIGFWHRDVCATLLEQLTAANPNWVIAVVDGSTDGNKRNHIQMEFNAGKIDCLLGQMLAMGTSWNLQAACSHILIAEELPGPGMLHQFYSRVYRKGQERHVHVDHMTSGHTLDEAIKQIRLDKSAVNEELVL